MKLDGTGFLLGALCAAAACGQPAATAADAALGGDTSPPDAGSPGDGVTSDGGSDASAIAHAFPKGFLWGTAIAGFQVDMGCPTLTSAQCDDPKSDWYQWVTDPDIKKDAQMAISGDLPSQGPGFWETWPQYLDAARNVAHSNGLRMSVEWSRLFPEAAAETATTVDQLKTYANKDAVARYHEMFKGAKDRGQTLLVTINHYTLPLWLHDGKDCHEKGLDPYPSGCKNRGWVDRDRILKAINLFAAYCGAEFGGEVDLWGTLNEPFAVVVAGYILPSSNRSNPPGLVLQIDAAVSVMFTMMEAHARIYDALHTTDKLDADADGAACKVGIVANLAYVVPADPKSAKDIAAVPHADWVYNKAFLEATIHGDLDRNLDGVIEEHRGDMANRMDFIGVNYYQKLPVNGNPIPGSDKYKFLDFQPDTALFATYPQGIAEEVKFAAQYKLPIYITENGTGDPKETGIEGFVKPHLEWLHKAISEGADVRGYFYWTLMDNYEWNHGVNEFKMGLFAVDGKTKAPITTPMATGFAAIATQNGF